MNLLLSRPSGTLSPAEGERDGVRGRWVGSRAQGAHKVRGVLSMNRAGCGSQTRGPDRASVRRSGSWSQCATEKSWRLSMNRPTPDPSQEGNSASVPDIDSPPPEGLGVGSWPQLTSEFWRCSLSMNPDEHPTSNVQRRTSNGNANPRSLRRSFFDVGCSMFSLGSVGSMCEFSFRGILSMNPLTPAFSPTGCEGGRRSCDGACRGACAQCAKFFREISPRRTG